MLKQSAADSKLKLELSDDVLFCCHEDGNFIEKLYQAQKGVEILPFYCVVKPMDV
jgi:hypothetical protein